METPSTAVQAVRQETGSDLPQQTVTQDPQGTAAQRAEPGHLQNFRVGFAALRLARLARPVAHTAERIRSPAVGAVAQNDSQARVATLFLVCNGGLLPDYHGRLFVRVP